MEERTIRLRGARENIKVITEERRSERAGRTKAERELRELHIRQTATDGGDAAAAVGGDSGPLNLLRVAFPLRPIGILRSCFAKRNGTPRQPLLVPAARAALTLRADLAPEFLDGLEQYSHCWVLYIFHMNTDLQRLWQKDGGGVKGKIRVPRLDGDKLGVFATRSPHRPCPVGLSVAQVLRVDGRTLLLGGADIVDGSPVLDIKPYLPFCDSVPRALAPGWVAERAEQEPLHVGGLEVPRAVDAQMQACWQSLARQGKSLYASYEEFKVLVAQVLSRDIRSVTQRVKVPQRAQQGQHAVTLQASVQRSHPGLVPRLAGTDRERTAGSSSSASRGAGSSKGGAQGGTSAAAGVVGSRPVVAAHTAELGEGTWHVVLDGMDISYEVEEPEGPTAGSTVVLRTAAVL
ncbi:hypothetical protein N2152v2_004983 [Parachlorella kessleri]